jgi:nucleoid-associated protein YgaU
VISAGSTAAPLAAPVDTGLFTQTLSSPYFYGSGGSSTYSGGFGGFSGSYAASYGATYVGNGSRYTGAGYTTPFDPYGPAPTGYGMNTGLPVLPAAAPVAAAPQVVYAHYGTPGTTTTAGGPTTPVAAAPAAAAAPATPPKPAAPKPAEPKKAEPKEDPKPEPKKVTVKSGDSLSKIAAAHGTTWQKLYELNKGLVGGNPNLIRPGQELKLP